MFAYCENNPVNNCDPSGRLAITIIGVVAAVVAALATANDVYQIARSLDNDNTDEGKVLVTPSDDNVHIENSYKILTPWMQYGYSFYLNHFNEGTKDIIQGSTKGVQYEWSLHNAAALLGFGESAENADIGKTIFADGDNRRLREDDGSLSEVGLMSLAMRLSYFVVSSPISWIGDLTVNGGF